MIISWLINAIKWPFSTEEETSHLPPCKLVSDPPPRTPLDDWVEKHGYPVEHSTHCCHNDHYDHDGVGFGPP